MTASCPREDVNLSYRYAWYLCYHNDHHLLNSSPTPSEKMLLYTTCSNTNIVHGLFVTIIVTILEAVCVYEGPSSEGSYSKLGIVCCLFVTQMEPLTIHLLRFCTFPRIPVHQCIHSSCLPSLNCLYVSIVHCT